MRALRGMGYAQEYHVGRLLREVLIPGTAPVSPQMIQNFLAGKVLDFQKHIDAASAVGSGGIDDSSVQRTLVAVCAGR